MDKKTVLAELVACLHGIEHDQKRLAETGCVMTTNAQTRKRIKAIEGAIEYIKTPETTRLVRHFSRPNVYADLWQHCEKCGERVDTGWHPKYCPGCGREVKWDDR